VLEERYAKGEIQRDGYLQKKRDRGSRMHRFIDVNQLRQRPRS
jgi:hypothetical protein